MAIITFFVPVRYAPASTVISKRLPSITPCVSIAVSTLPLVAALVRVEIMVSSLVVFIKTGLLSLFAAQAHKTSNTTSCFPPKVPPMFVLITLIFDNGSFNTWATECCTPNVIWHGVLTSITSPGRGIASTE
ncbi:hypothetical protein SDC9_158199 [bioreactor metagenome]|uniref:Uncharacterized protein n=1 Tax=bioreactor metagenome TaxID=1076179 RepID=A0A645FBG1_9ZZZZ